MMRKIYLIIVLFLLFSSVLPAREALYQKSILALYKSSENQSREENEIYFYMSRILEEMGFKIQYWDIDRGIPGNSVTRYSRAVISWFRGPSMREPEAYLDFMDRMIDEGKKYIVVDNFGAYQNRETEEFVQPLRLNTTLARLGVMYHGDWTQDGSLLEIDELDSSMVEDQGRQDVSDAAFFYRFIPSDRELKTYLSIRRTDKEYEASPVIVTNRHGGFALSRYIYRVENGTVKLLLDMEKYLRACLFPQTGRQEIALLVNSSVDEAEAILKHTENVLSRAKIKYVIIEPVSFRGMVKDDLLPYSSVGLILNSDNGLDPEILENYLQEGGRLVSLLNGRFNKLAPVLAIDRVESGSRRATGYRISPGVLTGENISIDDNSYTWLAGGQVPVDSAEVLATSFNRRTPLLWKRETGNGKVLTWNWDVFTYGDFMGFILESFLQIQSIGAAATPAISMMYLDDWPIPMYNVIKEPISDRIDTDFYMDTWWPDMKNILNSWDQPFSSYLIFNYNASTSPPFETGEFFVARNNGSMKMVEDHFENGIELGLHGYNHMSLTDKKSPLNAFVWSSPENMIAAVEQAREDWNRLFGEHNLPLTYVAPHNIISLEGISVLHKYFPSIKAVSTLHSGDNPEEAYDFGYHPEVSQIYMMPRLSYGYHFSHETKSQIISGITGPGVLSHFIHSDDVYDPARGQGKSWEELKEGLNEVFAFVRGNYPWLRPMNVYDGYRAMSEYDSQAIDFFVDNNSLTVLTNSPGVRFRVRADGKSLKEIQGGTVLYDYKSMDVLVVRAEERKVVLRF